MRFEWDPEKNRKNRKKHGLSFEDATELWDADHMEIYDEAHSDDEDRFIAVGMIRKGVVVVAFTEPEDDLVRIMSARVATKWERQRFQDWEGERNG